VDRLDGKVAIITGAGSGIGRAAAMLFAREGARVTVVDREAEAGQATADAIRSEAGEAMFVEADVADAASAEAMVRRTTGEWDRVDILYSNAGISMNATSVEDIDDAFFDQMYAVNVRSVYLGAKHVAPQMKKQGSGVILSTGSASGIRPRPGASAYSASKAAVIALSKSLAIELAPFGIRVLSINPFATDTPMLRRQMEEQNSEAAEKERVAAIPLGRLLTADDVAKAALFLVSDDAAMVTGTAFEIDGGRLI
jgi:3-oxoacyl-[acyl-carrier protein] reductase